MSVFPEPYLNLKACLMSSLCAILDSRQDDEEEGTQIMQRLAEKFEIEAR